MKCLWFALALPALLSAAIPCAAQNYHLIKEIPIPDEGGWDYLSSDVKGRLIYMAHGNEVVVINMKNDSVMQVIKNTPDVHGVSLAPVLSRAFATDGRSNYASIINLKNGSVLYKAETGENPDGTVYDPKKEEAYFFNGRGQSATVINGKTGALVATIPLPGRPEFPVVDSDANRIYDNIEDKDLLAVIDTSTHTVTNKWPVAPGTEPCALAIDTLNHRLFIGCRGTKSLVIMDSSSGKIITSIPIGAGVDACAFEPEMQMVFASCGDGTLTMVHEADPDNFTVVQTLATPAGSRTMGLDAKTHRIYVPAAEFGERKPGERRAPMIPGTLKVLVYAP